MRLALAILATTVLAAGCERRAPSRRAVDALVVAGYAQTSYRRANGVYAAEFAALEPHAALPPAVASMWAGGDPRDCIPRGARSRGYAFTLAATAASFTISATPADASDIHYLTDESQVVRWRVGAPAGPGDLPVSTP
jgi:hypothetical protein